MLQRQSGQYLSCSWAARRASTSAAFASVGAGAGVGPPVLLTALPLPRPPGAEYRRSIAVPTPLPFFCLPILDAEGNQVKRRMCAPVEGWHLRHCCEGTTCA